MSNSLYLSKAGQLLDKAADFNESSFGPRAERPCEGIYQDNVLKLVDAWVALAMVDRGQVPPGLGARLIAAIAEDCAITGNADHLNEKC
ncbi:hypothetical protein [Amycolatopsis minnesotensis]|uniref:Uncharacterized protein n=1 Tax=Amycolatopsis minnesotensis TaxID=337894 RepID=A0ABN2SI58_9PSEU